jgi:hypothetical protein
MNIRHPPLSLETINNPVLPLTNEQVHNIEFDVSQHQSKLPLLHVCDYLTKSGPWVQWLLEGKRRAADSCVNSSGLLKGLKGCLRIIETVSMGGSIAATRTRRGAYVDG